MKRNGNGRSDRRNNTFAWRDKRDRDDFELIFLVEDTLEADFN